MDRNWWVPVVQWTFWGVAMTVVMGWMAKSRMKLRADGERSTLRHPRSTLLLGMVGLLFFLGLAVISNTVGRNDSTNGWTTGIFLFFGAWSGALVAEYCVVRHRLTPEGLHYAPLLKRRDFVHWSDVTSVKYAPAMKWFKLHTTQGRTVRVPVMLMGLPEFAQHVLEKLPADRIDAVTTEILRETAAGRPPSVWN